MRDTWRIFDSYIFLYIYIPSTSREISTTRVSRSCVCMYTHTYMRGLSFLSGEKGKRRPVFWIFDEREHDVPPEFHSGPSRNACRWYFSARQIRVYMVKCSILSGESSYKREFLTFNVRRAAASIGPLLDSSENAKFARIPPDFFANSYPGYLSGDRQNFFAFFFLENIVPLRSRLFVFKNEGGMSRETGIR